MPNFNDESSFIGNPTGNSLTRENYSNPFYGIPHKYLPQNIDHMLWWSNHFLMRFGFYRSVLFRVANYFITALNIECDDVSSKKKYEELFDEIRWKQTLGRAGLNLLAYGNLFTSVNQGFERFLECPTCHKITNIDKLYDYEFTKEAKYIYKCPKCNSKTAHEVIDKPSKDIKKVNVTFWNPREVICRFEETTGEGEFFWKIPEEYKNKVMKPNNKFFSKKTPKIIYDSILKDKVLSFNESTFIHLSVPTPNGIRLDGKAIPFCIYLFDDFFMLKVLQRYNEAICFEDIAPFRVISMSDESNPQANPILTQGAPQWQAAVTKMVQDHRRDPASYHTFPFKLNYQQLGGDGKNLVTPDLIQQAIGNILNALYIPQELYTMTLQTQAVGPALRLFENSWSFIIDSYNQLLDHWGDVIGKIKGLPKAKISLVPVTLSDDMERKSIIGQLVSANAIAKSELLNLYGFDFKEQLRKKQEEDDAQKEVQEEAQEKEQLRQMAENGSEDSGGNGPKSPNDVLEQAKEIAQQLFPLEGAERRQKLQEIKTQDTTLWSATKAALEELTQAAKSQGVDQSKQQAGQQSSAPSKQQ